MLKKAILLVFVSTILLYIQPSKVIWEKANDGSKHRLQPPVPDKSSDNWTGVPALIKNAVNYTAFRYKGKGKPLMLLDIYKKKFDWPPRQYIKLNENMDVLRGFVFVTAADSTYYQPLLDTIAGIQQFSPGAKIVVWDVGLNTTDQIHKVKSLCDVEYRKFNFSTYPVHVRHLKNYAFKPIVITETMREFPRLIWMDTSIRFIKTGHLSHIKPQLLQTDGILQMIRVGHSIYGATHRQMYQYLRCDRGKIKHTEMGGATMVVLYRTEHVFKNIILFWVLCALEVNCIQPINQTRCDFRKLWYTHLYAGCHRFDQSALSVLLGNAYNYNFRLYRDFMAKNDNGKFVQKERFSFQNKYLKKCIPVYTV